MMKTLFPGNKLISIAVVFVIAFGFCFSAYGMNKHIQIENMKKQQLALEYRLETSNSNEIAGIKSN